MNVNRDPQIRIRRRWLIDNEMKHRRDVFRFTHNNNNNRMRSENRLNIYIALIRPYIMR